jgi:hypothetical protein
MTAVTVTDRSALASALGELKLSGMLGTLDARLAQAGAGELGHLDFLQVLCQDEISRCAPCPWPAASAGPGSRPRPPSGGSTSPPHSSCPRPGSPPPPAHRRPNRRRRRSPARPDGHRNRSPTDPATPRIG